MSVSGVGGAMVYAPMFLAISLYFDKNKGKAMAIGTLGDGLGALTMAPLARVLLDEYGFSGAILIIGALMLHNCTAGGLVRPLPVQTIHTVHVNGNSDVTSGCDTKCDTAHSLSKAEVETSSSCYSNCCDKVHNSTFISLLKSSTFVCYCFTVMSLPYTGQLIYMALPSLAKERGLSKTEGAIIVSIMGAGDMVGRFGFGFVYDMRRFRRRRSILFASFGLAIGVVSIIFGLQTHMAGRNTYTLLNVGAVRILLQGP